MIGTFSNLNAKFNAMLVLDMEIKRRKGPELSYSNIAKKVIN
jgi:hypothetical protein